MRWEIYDRYGNHIYMTNERWRHALEKRPWLADHLDDVLATIRHGQRRQDPLNSRKYKYYLACEMLEPEFNHIVAVSLRLFQRIKYSVKVPGTFSPCESVRCNPAVEVREVLGTFGHLFS